MGAIIRRAGLLFSLAAAALAVPRSASGARSIRSAPITWQSWVHWTNWPGPSGVTSQSTYYRSLTLSLTNTSSVAQTGKVTFVIGSSTDHISAGPVLGQSYRAQGRMFFRFINPNNWFDYAGQFAPVLLGPSNGVEFSSADTQRTFSLAANQDFNTTFSVHLTQPPAAVVTWGSTNDIGSLSIVVEIDQDRGSLTGNAMFRAMVGGGPTIYHPPQGARTQGDWRGEIAAAAYRPVSINLNGGRPF